MAILRLFGTATGLRTNLNKSSIIPIACSLNDVTMLTNATECKMEQFPCQYLGLPLSDKRLKRADFQRLLDKFMKKLACWKAKWITMAGRLTLVTSVLFALPAYQLMAIFHPKWLHKQLDKLRRAFLWAASDKVTGGKCLVNWTTVCLPKNLGGLGIPNLQMQSISLRVRWLWQQAYDSSKPWIGLPLPVDKQVTEIFQASTTIVTKSGRDTSFWNSHWLQGLPLRLRLPALFKHSKLRNSSVREALQDRKWISAIK
jgi:hypothetical protein